MSGIPGYLGQVSYIQYISLERDRWHILLPARTATRRKNVPEHTTTHSFVKIPREASVNLFDQRGDEDFWLFLSSHDMWGSLCRTHMDMLFVVLKSLLHVVFSECTLSGGPLGQVLLVAFDSVFFPGVPLKVLCT